MRRAVGGEDGVFRALADPSRRAIYEALAGGDSARLTVLTGLETKGLEFDGIVVVEPREIERESATGRSTLYVVLTRATQRLVTVAMR